HRAVGRRGPLRRRRAVRGRRPLRRRRAVRRRGPFRRRCARRQRRRRARHPPRRMSTARSPGMQLIDMKDYGQAARLYWWTGAAPGVLALGWGITGVVRMEPAVLLQVLVGAAVAAVVGLFPVRIPNGKTSIAGAEIFIFLLLLVYGPAAAIIAASLEGMVASW